MRALVNTSQAGNQSGTGTYTRQLVEWLPRVAPDAHFSFFGATEKAGALKRFAADQWEMRREARRLSADLVHYPATVGSLFPLRNCVITVHDLSFEREPGWYQPERAWYLSFAARRSVRYAARIIADSHATADDLQAFYGVNPGRIDVISLGVDDRFRPAGDSAVRSIKRKYGLPECYFLYMGTLEPRKNIIRIINAFSRIAGDVSADLVLAGRDGWKTAPIYAAIAASPRRERIHAPGFIEETDQPAVLSGALAFVWPSLWEGFGLPPLEAMACGTPVLTSDASSLPEVTGGAALLAPPEDTEAIADGMLRLATCATLRDELRAKGVERAQAFTWRETALRTCETYRRVLD